jgi:uncharacterized protein
LRTSIVLGEEGGAYPKMKWITRLGLGGNQGNGNQYMSTITIDDFCRAIGFIIDKENIIGSINVASPHPITNKAFMQGLRKKYNMPLGINAPVWLLEIASIFLRTETELFLKSRRVVPRRLMETGFEF